MRSFFSNLKHSQITPIEVFLLIPFTAFIYSLMEWLFFISKPSFLSSSSFFQKFLTLLNGTSILSILAILILIPGSILFFIIRNNQIRTIIRFLLCLPSAVIMACTLFLLVDNVTYTLFKFGVVSTEKSGRAFYLAGFLVLILLLTIPVFQLTHSIERSRRKMTFRQKTNFPMILGIFILVFAFAPMIFNPSPKLGISGVENEPETKPNILLITGDGLNATNTSVYGSKEDTTPFLRDLVPYSLVARNAYSNAQGTVGSTTSMLTGKYPADIRMLASTDILKNENAYQHLPGILKAQGYTTVQLSYSYYADAYRVNFQSGFDEANGETPINNRLLLSLAPRLPTNQYYFLRETYSRLSDRLGHLFYIQKMTNPFIQVTESPEKFNDLEKLEYLIRLLDESEQPIFVHLHWMGTHGPKYYPEEQVFSAGKDPDKQEKYEKEFYLDSILEFDRAISRIYSALEEHSIQDSTILVVSSDHTQRWSIARIPFLIRFPNGEHAGKVNGNVQNLDIAPTLLDYLGLTKPEWMSGQSLLEPIAPDRPIFIAAIPESKRNPKTNKVVYPPQVPPFYQFGKETVIVCDRYYTVNFFKMQVTGNKIPAYDGTCPDIEFNEEEALRLVIEHLQQYGFSTDTLKTILDETPVPTQTPN